MAKKPALPPGASRLPSGKIRLQFRDPRTGERLSPRAVDPAQPASYDTPAEAWRAYVELTDLLATAMERGVLLCDFWKDWTDEDHYLYGRKRSPQTLETNASRTSKFIQKYGHLPIAAIDGVIVDQFMRDGGKSSQIQGLSALFTDALDTADPPLVQRNPFAKLARDLEKIERGRREEERELEPAPSEAEIWALLDAALKLPVLPAFYGWLYVAAWTGARPGEVDAMKWEHLEDDGYYICEQFNTRLRRISKPKWNSKRTIELRPDVMQIIDAQPRLKNSPYIFNSTRETHFNAETRTYWWNKVRHLVGGLKIYLATRHFFITWAVDNGAAPHDLAEHIGHKDNGTLLMDVYYRPRQKDTRARRSMRDLYAARPIDLSAERKRRRGA